MSSQRSPGVRNDLPVIQFPVAAGGRRQAPRGDPPTDDQRIEANAAAGSVEAARPVFIARQRMGRLGTPEEIAALAVYLASGAARFVTCQAVIIDAGLTL